MRRGRAYAGVGHSKSRRLDLAVVESDLSSLRLQDPREQCAYLYDALNSIDATALPNSSDLARQVRAQPALRHHPRPPCALLGAHSLPARQAHRLMLAHGACANELCHVGAIGWLGAAIPLRVPPLLGPQEVPRGRPAAQTRDASGHGGSPPTWHLLPRSVRVALAAAIRPRVAQVTDTSLTALLKQFKGGLVAVFHAILERKRGIFLGHAQARASPR